MSSFLQLVGSGGGGSRLPPSLLLFFEAQRYLFGGSGEGTQRYANEAHLRVAKIRHIFLTRIHNETVGGLTGLLITLADLGVRRIGLHGPGGLRHFLQASRHVSVRSALTIDTNEAEGSQQQEEHPNETEEEGKEGEKPFFEDENISVEVIVLAEQCVRLPPLRTFVPRHQQQQQSAPAQPAESSAVAAPSTRPPAEDDTIPDPFLDESPAAAASSAITAASSTPAAPASPPIEPPACKKAKFSHAREEAPTATTQMETETPATSDPSISSSPSPPSTAASPPTLSYNSVNHAREAERVASDWLPPHLLPSLVCYIVSLAPVLGKFDLARARALGIPPGPLYAKLKGGESITIKVSDLVTPGEAATKQKKMSKSQHKKVKAGQQATSTEKATTTASSSTPPEETRTFHPSDCVAPPIPGPKFAIVDCPNQAMLDTLTSHNAWSKYQQVQQDGAAGKKDATSSSSSAPHLSVMIHITPRSLLSHPSYQSWMHSFGPRTHHVLLHGSISPSLPVFKGAALNYLKMQQFVNEDIFPAKLGVQQGEQGEGEEEREKEAAASLLPPFPKDMLVSVGCNLARFQLLPPPLKPHTLMPLDGSLVPTPIRVPDEVLKSLEEGSNVELRNKLTKWGRDMKEGKAMGKGVRQIAEEVLKEVGEDTMASSASASDDSTDDATPSSSSLSLPSPPSFPDYTPPSTLLDDWAQHPADLCPDLLFLGTGSAIPSKYRNVTGQFFHPGYEVVEEGTKVEVPPHPVGGVLMDCGEGSYGQLCLRYSNPASSPSSSSSSTSPSSGDVIVSNLLADLKCVWISHIHADHHLGLISVLASFKQTWMKRYQLRMQGLQKQCEYAQMQLVSPLHYSSAEEHHVPKLLVFGPRRLYYWLREYAAIAYQVGEEDQVQAFPPASTATPSPTLFDWVEFASCSELLDRSSPWSSFLSTPSPSTLHLYPSLSVRPRCFSVFQTVQVRHCHDAYGLIVESAAPPSLPALQVGDQW